MKLRHLLVALLALVLIAAACSSDSDDSAGSAETEATEEPTAEATEEPTEEPTEDPTEEPTEETTEKPTEEPTEEPPSNAFGALIAEAPEGEAFYLPPDPIPGEPGDVIWARESGPVEGGTLYTVLYTSEDLNGEPIATSGWIAVPDGEAPEGGRPVVSWGHGTRGVADRCAPSIQDDPGSADMPLIADMMERGIVVTGSDYEGLGTPGLHPYTIGISESNSMLDATRAALNFEPAVAANEVIIFGHSQGGHAMAFANELADDYAPELNVVASVGSGAGVVHSTSAIINYLINSDLKGYMMIAMGSQLAAYGPELAPPSRLLTPTGVEELAFLEEGCTGEILEYYSQFTTEELFIEDWDMSFTDGSDPDSLNYPGTQPGVSPMFLVHGTEDTSVPAAFVLEFLEAACPYGVPIAINWYEGAPHRVMYDRSYSAADDVLAFIDGQLAGEEPHDDCGDVPPIPGKEE